MSYINAPHEPFCGSSFGAAGTASKCPESFFQSVFGKFLCPAKNQRIEALENRILNLERLCEQVLWRTNGLSSTSLVMGYPVTDAVRALLDHFHLDLEHQGSVRTTERWENDGPRTL